MSTLNVATVRGTTTSPPTFQNSNGTEIGTLCRAWVNFNGTGTVAIRAQFNVSSITDNGAGDYTVNFTTAMPDANFSALASGAFDNLAPTSNNSMRDLVVNQPATGSIRIGSQNGGGTPTDFLFIYAAIFR